VGIAAVRRLELTKKPRPEAQSTSIRGYQTVPPAKTSGTDERRTVTPGVTQSCTPTLVRILHPSEEGNVSERRSGVPHERAAGRGPADLWGLRCFTAGSGLASRFETSSLGEEDGEDT